jgi:hypothetical protein
MGAPRVHTINPAQPTVVDRFPTAANGKPPTGEQRAASGRLHAATVALAEVIEAECPGGRDKSLALTHLEDTLMRANRALHTAS